MKQFYEYGQSIYFWLAGIAYLLLMEAIALYYQYALGFYPCALCVQVRAWVVGAMIAATVSVVFRSNLWVRFLGLTQVITFIAGGLHTSRYAWGVENGTVISSCTMGAGFPVFMPLDQWIPFFFGANGPCGQSPDMWFGLSMVETLLVTLGIPLVLLLGQWILHLPHAIVSAVRFAKS